MMKAALLVLVLGCISLHAQVGTSPRTLTKRIEPLVRPQPPRYVAPAQPGAAGAAVAKPPTAKQVEQKKLELDAETKKKLEWQMSRATNGSAPAQYAIGVRYLTGDGLPKDVEKGTKWLKESAKNDYADAKKKLAELEAAEKK
jgi:TPR repeat protein